MFWTVAGVMLQLLSSFMEKYSTGNLVVSSFVFMFMMMTWSIICCEEMNWMR